MTNEEAIHILDNLKPTNTKGSFDAYVIGKAISIAIKALAQDDILDNIKEEIKLLSNANPSYWHSGDMVEREEVFDIIDKYRK